MIRVYYNRNDSQHELSVTGHAGYDSNGNDIVCAGVSAITYALLGMLENQSDSVSQIDTVEESGDVYICCDGDNAVNLAFEMALIGIMQIEKRYPDYVSVMM